MNEFKTYHPIVNFVYFVFVLAFSMVFTHPVCIAVSFFGAVSFLFAAKGKKQAGGMILYAAILMLVMAVVNPLFNHDGATIITYFPDGNPLTAESVIYGICMSAVIACVIIWFSCYSAVMTSDKFIYLFGRIIPGLSLILSMTLKFVPEFTSQLKKVADAQKCMGRGMSDGNILHRIKNGLSILSAMVTKSLENSIDTADSMKARGYGLKGRTAFSIFRFEKRDALALLLIMIFGIYVLVGSMCGAMSFSFFPRIKYAEISAYHVSVFVLYFALCVLPLIIELWEVRRWNALRSKI